MAAALIMIPKLDDTLGVIEVGTLISCVLYGVSDSKILAAGTSLTVTDTYRSLPCRCIYTMRSYSMQSPLMISLTKLFHTVMEQRKIPSILEFLCLSFGASNPTYF